MSELNINAIDNTNSDKHILKFSEYKDQQAVKAKLVEMGYSKKSIKVIKKMGREPFYFTVEIAR